MKELMNDRKKQEKTSVEFKKKTVTVNDKSIDTIMSNFSACCIACFVFGYWSRREFDFLAGNYLRAFVKASVCLFVLARCQRPIHGPVTVVSNWSSSTF